MFESTSSPADEPDDGVVEDVAGWVVEPHWSELEECDPGYAPSSEVLLADAVAQPTGIGLVTSLRRIDPARLSVDDAVTLAQQWERVAAWVAGERTQALATVNADLVGHFEPMVSGSGFVFPEQAAEVELAAALRVSEFAVARRVEDANELTGAWRPLLDALLAGEVSEAHVRVVGRELRKLPSFGEPDRQADYIEECADILGQVIPHAAVHSPRSAGDKTQRLVVAIDPAGARKRRQEVAEQQHGVYLGPGDEPGTCQVTAVMPIAHGQAVVNAVDTLTRDERFQTAPGCATLGQRRVAALVALVFGEDGTVTIDGPVSEAKIRCHVDVVVPAATIAAFTGDNPVDVDVLQGGLVGSRPVTADVLVDLLAECDPASTLRKLVTDANGSVVDLGRTRYAISEIQRRLITARDRVCRHPGCTRPAIRSEIACALGGDC